MERYQIAKIVDWAGRLDTRKRLQKVAYLLKMAGCPIDAEYTLHRYGPYSQDVAQLTDEMVQLDLLVESAVTFSIGRQFSYRLTESAESSLAEFEAAPKGRSVSEELEPFKATALLLFQSDLKDLEFASTIVFFLKQGRDWPAAIAEMCRFKNLKNGSQVVLQAEALARKVVG